MGADWSSWGPVPEYKRDVSDASNYDHWGYIPIGLKPSQQVWHTYFNEGGAPLNAPQLWPDPRPMLDRWAIADSLPSMILANKLMSGDRYFSGIDDTKQGDMWPAAPKPGVVTQPNTQEWQRLWFEQQQSLAQRSDPTSICNPMNFPFCTMKPMFDGTGEAFDYRGESHTGMDLWARTIDDLYTRFYVNGNVDMLKQINTEDTSAFDPCADPGFLAEIMPVILGLLAGGGFQKILATDMRNVLSELTMNTWSGGTFMFGFFYMRAAMGTFGTEERNLDYATFCIALPAGLSIGDLLINQGTINAQPSTLYIAGCALSYFVVYPAVRGILALPGPLSFVLKLVFGMLDVVGTFICRLFAPKPDSCAAVDGTGQKIFPDARRWDAASIAAKLTDEIRSEEGWQRDDPRSEFAFKALLTGPAMMDVARPPQSQNFMWANGVSNPLGNIYAPRSEQTDWGPGQYFGPGSTYGWDGSVGGWMDVADNNSYSCQNWDVMRTNTHEAKRTPKTQQVKNRFDEWVDHIRISANNPAALAHAGIGKPYSAIPGWKGGVGGLEKTVMWKTDAQWLEFIDEVYSAKDIPTRYKAIAGWQDVYAQPSDPVITLWLTANEFAYTYIALKTNKTLVQLWQYLEALPITATPELTSATLYAIAATQDSPDIAAFWANAPGDIRDLAVAFPPPKTKDGTVLPFGAWKVNRNWHKAAPLQPIADKNSICKTSLQIIRNPLLATEQNLTLLQLYRMIDGTITNVMACPTCSQDDLAILLSYRVSLDAVLEFPYTGGVGNLCQMLVLGFKWSDQSMSACLQELATPLINQSELNSYLTTVFLTKPIDKSGRDWSAEIAAWQKVDGHFDNSTLMCEVVTSLTSLVDPPLPGPIAAPIYGSGPVFEDPPHTVPGMGHPGPFQHLTDPFDKTKLWGALQHLIMDPIGGGPTPGPQQPSFQDLSFPWEKSAGDPLKHLSSSPWDRTSDPLQHMSFPWDRTRHVGTTGPNPPPGTTGPLGPPIGLTNAPSVAQAIITYLGTGVQLPKLPANMPATIGSGPLFFASWGDLRLSCQGNAVDQAKLYAILQLFACLYGQPTSYGVGQWVALVFDQQKLSFESAAYLLQFLNTFTFANPDFESARQVFFSLMTDAQGQNQSTPVSSMLHWANPILDASANFWTPPCPPSII